jgi:hypothetical protein
MIKVSITRQGVITNQATFPTQAEAEAWQASVAATGAFGKTAGTYPLSQLSEQELSTEISRVETNASTGEPLIEPLITIPDQFQVEYTDITAEIEQQKKIRKYETRIAFAQRLMAEISATNSDKYESGEITLSQLQSAEEKLAKVQRLLLNGSTGLALAEIIAIEATLTEYPQSYKDELKAKIQAFLAAEST